VFVERETERGREESEEKERETIEEGNNCMEQRVRIKVEILAS
jgi:hypothetical protein